MAPINLTQDTSTIYLQLDALSTFWQFDQMTLDRLENFIYKNFKYPKGGGWDLNSLRADILWQNDLLDTPLSTQILPQELANQQNIDLKKANAVQLISKEILQRYKPIINGAADQLIIQEISQVIYAMEAVRLGIFKPTISDTALPSAITTLLNE